VRAFRRWNKEGKRLRRSLQPVRDADVYLARLGGFRASLIAARNGEAKFSPRCLRQIDKLEGRLKQRRRRGIDRLIAVLDARGKRLYRRSREMEATLTPLLSSRTGSTAPAALRILAGLAIEFPALDSANLHAFRKRLKPALYLAAISAPVDPLSGRLAAAFKKIHLAAGEWHDWQTLVLEARRILPGHSRKDGLIPMLETLTEETLQRALDLCRRFEAELLKGEGEILSSSQRKPVAAVPHHHPGIELPFLKASG
jgi:hypothetical protein